MREKERFFFCFWRNYWNLKKDDKIDKLKINSEKLVILINDFKNDKRKWQVQDEWSNDRMCL